MTTPTLAPEDSAATQLRTTLDRHDAQRIFLVTGKDSFLSSGAAELTSTACIGRVVERFSSFSVNPQCRAVNRGIALCRAFCPDLIVGVGGGSVMDMAKLIAVALSSVQDDIAAILTVDQINRELPLVAMPTTAGSGSEATQFAVLYIDGSKHSVDAPALLPDDVILDASLTLSASSYQSALSGVDALCQAIESLWSIGSTPESRDCSQRAIELILANIEVSVNSANLGARQNMLSAANLAGQAINTARTTAPHALSYVLTSAFGIPHGQAVALSLAQFLEINADYENRPLNDLRGTAHLRAIFKSLFALFAVEESAEFVKRFHGLLTSIGLSTSLAELGVEGRAVGQKIAANVNLERLKNNPVAISTADLHQVINAMQGER